MSTPPFGPRTIPLSDSADVVLRVLRELEPPERIRAALDAYASGALTERGHFLTAVLENDLRRAVGYADPVNRAALPCIVEYCVAQLPPESWGSPERVRAWQAQHRPDAVAAS